MLRSQLVTFYHPDASTAVLKRRPAFLVYSEILKELSGRQLGKTRLARICNIPLDRFDYYVGPLADKGLVRNEISEGHEVFRITEEGMKLLYDLESVLRRLSP
jgi:predicted transcriptional regulator